MATNPLNDEQEIASDRLDELRKRVDRTARVSVRQDDPLVVRTPGEYDQTLHDAVREFVTNIMGADAYRHPSEAMADDEETDPTQATPADAGGERRDG